MESLNAKTHVPKPRQLQFQFFQKWNIKPVNQESPDQHKLDNRPDRLWPSPKESLLAINKAIFCLEELPHACSLLPLKVPQKGPRGPFSLPDGCFSIHESLNKANKVLKTYSSDSFFFFKTVPEFDGWFSELSQC